MRWKLPREGDKKVKSRFAFYPTVIHNERIWLEVYQVHYVYTFNIFMGYYWRCDYVELSHEKK